jgi:hypothetical protein
LCLTTTQGHSYSTAAARFYKTPPFEKPALENPHLTEANLKNPIPRNPVKKPHPRHREDKDPIRNALQPTYQASSKEERFCPETMSSQSSSKKNKKHDKKRSSQSQKTDGDGEAQFQSPLMAFNKLARLVAKERELLKRMQAVDTSPWLVLERGLHITQAVEKCHDGVVRLSPIHCRLPIFNTEDVANNLEVYSGIVSLPILCASTKNYFARTHLFLLDICCLA